MNCSILGNPKYKKRTGIITFRVSNDLWDVFTKFAKANESMTDLSYQVDIEEKNPDDVARQFLIDQGLLK